ncbi:YqhR family membrane protein [Alkalihalobacillus sp. LMS39]|uniref:YqhR family membrane protein n=1 Tax=Alkalihalobacillus sp. LMS39 TaxID=2924032 RepID=UPI001FB2B33B|nr:YqhR family membrane protein [Alkalihalobacillus sp. LMS39]UOE95909.1 YqhR family membrane protein [Alkalihalobacillus sp. LMS39]
MANRQLEQNRREEPMTFNAKVATIGFCGGIFWGLIGYLAFFFNFMRVGPALVLMPWALGDWKNGYIGQIVGIFVIGLLSILVAFLYMVLLKKFNNIWAGLGYGLVLWGLVFYLLNPVFHGLKPLNQLDSNTIITSICLYILYGVFIGYSISYEYEELNQAQQRA